MLTDSTQKISNTRFVATSVLLYLLALTVSVWVPESSPIKDQAIFIKLALVPLAQMYLIAGAKHRWPENYTIVVAASTALYLGLFVSTIVEGVL